MEHVYKTGVSESFLKKCPPRVVTQRYFYIYCKRRKHLPYTPTDTTPPKPSCETMEIFKKEIKKTR